MTEDTPTDTGLPRDPDIEEIYREALESGALISADAAAIVWYHAHELGLKDPHLSRMFFLMSVLDKELARGERCAVCGALDDPACIEGC